MSNETNQAPSTSGVDGKTIAIISYLTWIGWIIAFVLYNSNKSQLAAYHLRQSLALMILGIIVYIVQIVLIFIPFLGWAIAFLLWIGLVVLWVFGLIAAVNGEEKPMPIIGEKAQELFRNI